MNATSLTVLVLLAILASVLVFSLMISDVDGKTYEYGMLRALGFQKPYLVSMITINSFSFSIPGMIGGIIVAYIMNIGLRESIFLAAKNALSYNLTKSSLVLGICFGILMPFISNYVPIKNALDKSLRKSLDQSKRTED